MIDQMYVEYMLPKKQRGTYPIGSCMAAAEHKVVADRTRRRMG